MANLAKKGLIKINALNGPGEENKFPHHTQQQSILSSFTGPSPKSLFFKQSTTVANAVFILMALEAFAIFFDGAYFLDAMTFCVVGAWVVLLAVAWLNRDELFWGSRRTIILVVTLLVFWFWTGLSFFWSISADLTWIEFNRTGGYLAVFITGVVVGRYGFARTLASVLFLVSASAAAFYSLGIKALPQVVDNIDNLARASVPLGYANALGLLLAMAYPLTLYYTASRTSNWLLRLFAAAIGPLLLVGLFFTISRGALLAIILGLLCYFILVPIRLRSFGALLLSLPSALLISFWSSRQDAFMHDKVDLTLRIAAATPLRQYLALAVAAAVVIVLVALLAGKKLRLPLWATRLVGGSLLAITIIAVVTGVVLFVSSKPSFSAWIQQTYDQFTSAKSTQAGAARLLQVNSAVRWRLWQEAITNWKEHPINGSGAQSFPITHLMKRESDMPFVKQAHGMPFGLLSELGLVGFTLMGAFVFTSLMISLLVVTKIKNRWERGLAGALFSVVFIYLVHSTYDWDWNMVALTLPYFLFTGMLVGWFAQPHAGKSQNSSKEIL